jgi:DNA replication protein DnaC
VSYGYDNDEKIKAMFPPELRRFVTHGERMGICELPTIEQLKERQQGEIEEVAARLEQRALNRTPETVPVRAWDVISSRSFDEKTPAVEAARTWFTSGKTLLGLVGGCGSGKTVAAADLVRSEFRTGRSAIWVQGYHVPRASGLDAASRERWEQLLQIDLLVVDDIGQQYLDAKGWATAALETLLCERFGEARRTVLTSNADTATFKQLIGERLVDRFRESGTLFVVGGASLRGKAR